MELPFRFIRFQKINHKLFCLDTYLHCPFDGSNCDRTPPQPGNSSILGQDLVPLLQDHAGSPKPRIPVQEPAATHKQCPHLRVSLHSSDGRRQTPRFKSALTTGPPQMPWRQATPPPTQIPTQPTTQACGQDGIKEGPAVIESMAAVTNQPEPPGHGDQRNENQWHRHPTPAQTIKTAQLTATANKQRAQC